MHVTPILKHGEKILVLEAENIYEKMHLEELARDWDTITGELHHDEYHEYPCLVLRKETP